MTPHAFVRKWQDVELSERSSCQTHFVDLCALLEEPNPVEADPKGEWFTFEKGVTTTEGRKGYADVWRKGCFGWEYKRKGKHKTLGDAYKQLQNYREALENPPLLIVSDIERIEIHTNFNNCLPRVEALSLAEFTNPKKLAVLRRVFADPLSFKPGPTKEQVTGEVAARFCKLADGLRSRSVDSERAAHFLVRLVFCLYVEHARLLTLDPDAGRVFTDAVRLSRNDPRRLTALLSDLFNRMAHGGFFGTAEIRHFNGGLFDNAEVIDLTAGEIADLLKCADADWSGIDPTISGTLFERIIDPDKRSQLGAHYTRLEDIETLLRPVFLAPLRRKWDDVRAEADELWANLQPAAREASLASRQKGDRKLKDRSRVAREKFDTCLRRFFDYLTGVRVLDPACGSGNFLYVALRMLLELHKEVWQYASIRGVTMLHWVTPRHFYGLEKNEYARELAEAMLWVGYIQWGQENPLRNLDAPVLGNMDNIEAVDAILDTSDPTSPKEPKWPDADFIVGNPPFLGGKMLRSRLGDAYVENLFRTWAGRVRPEADLCCYWFEKSRALIESGKVERAGLLATQGIRGGANRDVLTKSSERATYFLL